MENSNLIDKNISTHNIKIGNFNIINGNVKFGKGVEIGNNCTLEGDIFIGSGTKLENNIVIKNHVQIGEHNLICSGSCIGYPAQTLKEYIPHDRKIKIGTDNIFRENCTIHLPTVKEYTKIGNDGFFMVNTHISHDTEIGNNVVIANNGSIGGFSIINDYVNVGLNTCIHQHSYIGSYAMIGMGSNIRKDVLPFTLVVASINYSKVTINLIGYKRNYKGTLELKDISSVLEKIKKSESLLETVHDIPIEFEDFCKKSNRGFYL